MADLVKELVDAIEALLPITAGATWEFFKSTYCEADRVYVLDNDATHDPLGVRKAMKERHNLPRFTVIAVRDLTYDEQEAAVACFLTKRNSAGPPKETDTP